MEKFVSPKDKAAFVKWLLQSATNNNWAIVFEYSLEGMLEIFTKSGKQISPPSTGCRNHHPASKLIAIKNPSLTDDFIRQIMNNTHVLSVHNETDLLFLVADDFHEDCFSCSTDFYNKYYQIWCIQGLIYNL